MGVSLTHSILTNEFVLSGITALLQERRTYQKDHIHWVLELQYVDYNDLENVR